MDEGASMKNYRGRARMPGDPFNAGSHGRRNCLGTGLVAIEALTGIPSRNPRSGQNRGGGLSRRDAGARRGQGGRCWLKDFAPSRLRARCYWSWKIRAKPRGREGDGLLPQRRRGAECPGANHVDAYGDATPCNSLTACGRKPGPQPSAPELGGGLRIHLDARVRRHPGACCRCLWVGSLDSRPAQSLETRRDRGQARWTNRRGACASNVENRGLTPLPLPSTTASGGEPPGRGVDGGVVHAESRRARRGSTFVSRRGAEALGG